MARGDNVEGDASRHPGVPLWGVGFGIPVIALLGLAQHFGYVAHVPLALIVGEILMTLVTMALFTSRFPPGTARAKPHIHMCAQIALVGLIVYTLGWGSLLAVGFIFPAINIMSTDGSRLGPWAVVCVLATVGAGEALVALGVVHTMVPGAKGHGLALLEAAGASAVLAIVTYNQRDKERVERAAAEQGERFRALVQHASDIILVVGPDGTISYASPAFESLLGYSAASSVGMDAMVLASSTDAAALERLIEDSGSDGVTANAELRLRHQDRSWRWCEVTVTDLHEAPAIGGWVANIRDITERKQAEEARRESDAALREAQEVFRHAFDEAGVAMALMAPDGTVLRANGALAQLLAYPGHDALVGVNVMDLTHPEERTRAQESLELMGSGALEQYRAEQRCVRREGQIVWVSLTASMVRDEAGVALYSICQLEDVTQRRALSDRLTFEATHDPLTGLANRARLIEQATAALERPDASVALLFIDLDQFKDVNDNLGHTEGDGVLRAAAARLQGVTRPQDVIARFGGDEFVVLCQGLTEPDAASHLANRLLEALAGPGGGQQGDTPLTASIGIALSEPGDTAESLLRRADEAMYRAKREGRGRAVTFTQSPTWAA